MNQINTIHCFVMHHLLKVEHGETLNIGDKGCQRFRWVEQLFTASNNVHVKECLWHINVMVASDCMASGDAVLEDHQADNGGSR